MRSIGIRELRQHASKYLRLVKEGESIEITERGEPVAVIKPLPRTESLLERLEREGRITKPEEPGGIAGIQPLPAQEGETPLSEQLIAEREESPF